MTDAIASSNSHAFSPDVLLGLFPAESETAWSFGLPPSAPIARHGYEHAPSLTDSETAVLDDLDSLVRERIRRHVITKRLRMSVQERLQIHQLEALQDREPFSEVSAREALEFLSSITFTRDPAVFLNDAGTTQIRWRNAEKEQINIEFLGNGHVRYVRFLMVDAGVMERSASLTTIDVLKKLLVEPDQQRILSR